jgi:hypothetical protein
MWKYGFASVAGTAHVKSSVPLQDFSVAELMLDARGEQVFIAIASDGAGSAANSQAGAKLACETLLRELQSHFANGGELKLLTKDFVANWIEKFQNLIRNFATETEMKSQDFACTLLAAIVGKDQAAYFQIGDGAIVQSLAEEKDRYSCVCWPQQGEYANSTNFLTDAAAKEKVFCGLKTGTVDEVALFTDGIQNLVLDYRNRTAHAPFFTPLFTWLRPRPEGYSKELSDSLSQYLNSEKINTRTDDDKTLILATRRKQ